MTTAFFCAAAFLGCLMAGNRSLKLGLLTLISIGYGYGILRANFPDVWTYLMFDAGVVGLFAAQLWRPIPFDQRPRINNLRMWMVALMAWPTLLFIVFPSSNPLVELVGLRGQIFLLPFLILGARLDTDDLYWLAQHLAFLNLAVVAFAVVQYFVGIEPFFPKNEVTDIIYRSRDVVERSAYRIPSSFSSAHAFSGTLVVTLPLIVGAWAMRRPSWQTPVLASAILASLLGIFIAAARLHMISAAVLVCTVTLFGRLARGQRLKWIVLLVMAGYVVAGNARMQRFTTLGDTGFVSERIAGSVNKGVLELIGDYPLGNGLAGGGTSVPYFLQRGAREAVGMESEYARIAVEQGIPGIFLWVMFIAWFLTRRPWRRRDEWRLGMLAGWVMCAFSFATGAIGTGLLTSIPHTVLLLLTTGWTGSAAKAPLRVSLADRRGARLQPAAPPGGWLDDASGSAAVSGPGRRRH